VEDDRDLSAIARIHLEAAGYVVAQAFLCEEARAIINKRFFDLVLLDIMIPDGSGQDVCTYIRARSACPIIFMSCIEDSPTIIASLAGGGDDYVTKPVRYEELLARVEANIRRYRELPGAERKREVMRRFRRFTVDTARRRVLRTDQEGREHDVGLTALEYGILLYLTDREGELTLYDDLYENVWETPSFGEVKTVMVHASNLRKKIDPEGRGVIENVRGVGYLFADV
jgi:DNA-binding response OmpR family regulator